MTPQPVALVAFPWRALATMVQMKRDIDEEGCGALFGALVDEADDFCIGPPCLQREFERRYQEAWT